MLSHHLSGNILSKTQCQTMVGMYKCEAETFLEIAAFVQLTHFILSGFSFELYTHNWKSHLQ